MFHSSREKVRRAQAGRVLAAPMLPLVGALEPAVSAVGLAAGLLGLARTGSATKRDPGAAGAGVILAGAGVALVAVLGSSARARSVWLVAVESELLH
jgi:hypothetical protein